MKVLPSNEDFKKLTLNQLIWLKLNMEKDDELERKALQKATSDGETFEIDINDYVDNSADDIGTDDLMKIAKERMGKRK